MIGRTSGFSGLRTTYQISPDAKPAPSNARRFTLGTGPAEAAGNEQGLWITLEVAKENGQRYGIWLLAACYPPESIVDARRVVSRYILKEGECCAYEFWDRSSERALLPCLGAWRYLLPRADGDFDLGHPPESVSYLGHPFELASCDPGEPAAPPQAERLELLSDVLVGVPHNTKAVDDLRRFNGSDYEYVRLSRDDYVEMAEAGMNCFRVDLEQAGWLEGLPVFYWGVKPAEIGFPEWLYRSNYLGPDLFFDEPAVCTRDGVIRPRLEADRNYRRRLSVQTVLEEFRSYFDREKGEGPPLRLIRGLAARPNVNLGAMWFPQENLYTWETMVGSAAYQLRGSGPPSCMVFEPPGRVGTLRTLPEMNMAYGCQIPVDDPKNLASIIFGFLRGAARVSHKSWGTSIYGQMDRADSFWFLTHAYDLGATHFFYWDAYQLACVPRSEYMALSRCLKARVETNPSRDLDALEKAGEVVILLPAGYNLGHVYMGRGLLWGLGELNLERANGLGVKHRVIMANFFAEIERCIRLGVAFDLLWDLEGLDLSGYREIVRVREDGRVEVEEDGRREVLDRARQPSRPGGRPPTLNLSLFPEAGVPPLKVTATSRIEEGSARIYYTTGADSRGAYNNVMVLLELFGPEDCDYRSLSTEGMSFRDLGWICRKDGRTTTIEAPFILDSEGTYRIRCATSDMAGRTAVAWKTVKVGTRKA